jgi:hypothetical protein
MPRFVCLLLLCACDDEGLFVIPAGQHDSGWQVDTFSGPTLSFRARFDGSAVYTTVDPTNQGDINKLYGFSDCTAFHQDDSARVGWRWYGGRLEAHAYTYAAGVRSSALLGALRIGDWHDFEIVQDGPEYRFRLDGGPVMTQPRGCDGDGGVKYRLYQYFGGDEVAPHEVSIEIDAP